MQRSYLMIKLPEVENKQIPVKLVLKDENLVGGW